MIWDAVAKLKAFPWKTFETWDSAAASCSSYENDLLSHFRVARDDLNRKNERVIDLEGNALLWVTALLPGHLAVTDFGGATGEFGEALQLLRPDIEYTVVENATLVAALAAKNKPVRFATELPGECDVFFTSCSLQYIRDPYSVLVAGCRSAKRAVILVHNNFSERDSIRVQRSPLFNNGGGAIPAGFHNSIVAYPLRTVSELRVRSIAAELGFKLIARVPERSEDVAHFDKAYSVQLVFLRVVSV
jgi:putative methyltransferase (TIGR04325 family)